MAIAIGGVRTNFRMPDLLSLGLGGGSLVQAQRNRVSVGPRSVGSRLTVIPRGCAILPLSWSSKRLVQRYIC